MVQPQQRNDCSAEGTTWQLPPLLLDPSDVLALVVQHGSSSAPRSSREARRQQICSILDSALQVADSIDEYQQAVEVSYMRTPKG